MDVKEQTEQYLRALPNVLFRVLNLWAIITRDAIANNTPVDKGILKAGNQFSVIRGSEGPDCTFTNEIPYALFVEAGSDHPAQEGKLWRFLGSDGWVFTRKIKAFSIPAQPFFFSTIDEKLPELEQMTDQALQQLGDSVFK